ncbi:MAG: UDP-N-acetylglucosamine 2-epimerase [Promethearchaeota archaeon]|jgi:UDP-hydrolysing UDP-N-acetyl-D-glucosamine 2-epimerase
MKSKHICVVTGSRAEYNYLKLLMKKIEKSSKLQLTVLITGMHLLKKYGNTIDLIKRDGFPNIIIVPMYDENANLKSSLGIAVGKSLTDFTKILDELEPDLLVVLGDRYEPFVAVIAASTLTIPIGHIHGGDISGNIDENLRHAITKLSHLHFPGSYKSAKRLQLLGEEEWRINMVGSPTIDNILSENLVDRKVLCSELKLNAEEQIIACLQHSNTYESEKAGEQMKTTLRVLKDLDLQVVIIYPNNDLGSKLIISEIDKSRNNKKFKIFKNLESSMYLSLLKYAELLIGNSSGGLIESPIFKLPVVNIGTRNKDRESAENVIHVNHDYDQIKSAVIKALSHEFKENCKKVINPYGDGTSTDKIIKILEDIEIGDEFFVKKLTYQV